MTEDYVDEFVRENFGAEYLPVLHGQASSIQPLALLIKKSRKWYKRPFARSEMRVLAGLQDYVEDENKELFKELVMKHKIHDETVQKKKGIPAESDIEAGCEVPNLVNAHLHLEEERGDLELGKLKEKYYKDPGLRDILSSAILKSEMMAPYEDQTLLLVTAVVYSEKFEVKGKREYKFQVEGTAQVPQPLATFLGSEVGGHMSYSNVPPSMATRDSPAPFLFKYCHVDYDKEANKLQIRDGEFVGKSVVRDCDLQKFAEKDDREIETLVLDLETEDGATRHGKSRLTADDYKKIEDIEKLLLTVNTTQQRKCIVHKYLNWFEKALTENKKKFTINKPLTAGECAFLWSLYVSAVPDRPGQQDLNLGTLDDKEIQGYGLVFKELSELSDEKWEELHKVLAYSRENEKHKP